MASYAGWRPSKVQVFKNNVLIGEWGSVNSCSLTFFPNKAHTYLHALFAGQKEYYSKKLNLLFIKIEKKGYLKPNNSLCSRYNVYDKQKNEKIKIISTKELKKHLTINGRFYREINRNGFYEDEKYKIYRAD